MSDFFDIIEPSKSQLVYDSLITLIPSAKAPHINALEQTGLIEELDIDTLGTIVKLMQHAYQRGKASAGAEQIDVDCVWVDGVGGLEVVDGKWTLTTPDRDTNPAAQLGRKGGKSTSAAKRKASRENGKKGGRPRKTSMISAASVPTSHAKNTTRG